MQDRVPSVLALYFAKLFWCPSYIKKVVCTFLIERKFKKESKLWLMPDVNDIG
jgi:hypothetical protein